MTMRNVMGIEVQSGTRGYGTLPVTTLASGLTLEIPVHVVNGHEAGPVILLTALSHGDATTGLECIRQVLEQVDIDVLKGAIIAVPCQNPIGFAGGTRNTTTDSYNMNRTYPGNERGWITEMMAATISPLCDFADVLIDWHGGGFGCAINYMLLRLGAGGYTDKDRELGLAFGMEYYYGGNPAGPATAYMGNLSSYMQSLGKVGLVAEIGAGMDVPFDIIGNCVRGVFNVMKKMGMLPGEPVLPAKQWVIKDRPLVRPKNGGLFYPVCGPECLNKVVPRGTLMSQVRCPLTLEVIEEIYAPCEQTVFLDIRGLMTRVHPGSYAYILGDLSTAELIENET